jgi:choline dehydrogenase-like flavoprotein
MRYSGWHLIGTALMGNDPSTSVVDGWGRAHDVDNLFIVDGSVFPTSGGVNPTSTIVAFAARTADYLIANRRDQKAAA